MLIRVVRRTKQENHNVNWRPIQRTRGATVIPAGARHFALIAALWRGTWAMRLPTGAGAMSAFRTVASL